MLSIQENAEARPILSMDEDSILLAGAGEEDPPNNSTASDSFDQHGKGHARIRATLFPDEPISDEPKGQSTTQTGQRGTPEKYIMSDTSMLQDESLTNSSFLENRTSFLANTPDSSYIADPEPQTGNRLSAANISGEANQDASILVGSHDSSCMTMSSLEATTSSHFIRPFDEKEGQERFDHPHRYPEQNVHQVQGWPQDALVSNRRRSRHHLLEQQQQCTETLTVPMGKQHLSASSARSTVPLRRTLTPSSMTTVSAPTTRRLSLVRILLWVWTSVGLVSSMALILYQSTYLDQVTVVHDGQMMRGGPRLVSLPSYRKEERHRDDSVSRVAFSDNTMPLVQLTQILPQKEGDYPSSSTTDSKLTSTFEIERDNQNSNDPMNTPRHPISARLKHVVPPPPNQQFSHHRRHSLETVNKFPLFHHDPARIPIRNTTVGKHSSMFGSLGIWSNHARKPIRHDKPRAVSLDGRSVSFSSSVGYPLVRHSPLELYPAPYTDQTQLYGVLDSDDPRVRETMEQRQPLDNGECVHMKEWQTTFHPSCNEIHSMGLEQLGDATSSAYFHLFGTHGFWRNAWRVDILSSLSNTTSNDPAAGTKFINDTVVLKTLKINHNFEEAHFEHDRVDAVAMERLTASKHVINIFGFCGHSVVTEYATGYSLGKLADKMKKVPLARLRIARNIAEGLADVHGIDPDLTTTNDNPDSNSSTSSVASLVHLDINPANVISVGGTLKLNDFNIGILQRWNVSSINGTQKTPCGFPAQFPNPQWRSPEEARNEQNLTEKVDVFSLGHIFFRLICGHEPWNKLEPGGKPSKTDMSLAVQQGKLPTIPQEIMDSTNEEIVAIRQAMLACYAVDPRKRPSAQQITNQLQNELNRLEQKQQEQERKARKENR